MTVRVDDGDYTAVLDRFEEGRDSRLAVLVLERDGESVGDLVVDPDRLPAEGRETDAVFDVRVREGELRAATYRPAASSQRAEDAQSRFDRLARRPPSAGREDSEDGDDRTEGDGDGDQEGGHGQRRGRPYGSGGDDDGAPDGGGRFSGR